MNNIISKVNTSLVKLSLYVFCLFFQNVFADSSANNLEKLLANYHSYQASFSQINYNNKNKAAQRSQGLVYLAKPGKFRWEILKPYQQTVIANGDTVWIYDVDLAQATRQSLSKRGFNAAQLLTEPATELSKKFTISEEDGWFKLTPNKTDKGFKAAFLKFQNNQLVALKIINQLNQTNLFTFSQIQINPKLNTGLFNFKAPAGVKVLKG
ncbi:MAG: outer membrane lipoprotein chaperone LolA [Proteobacteria bacterium]|nr:outer membrane lipoprotein chaperone LolA [Pseudomonadota bacterium]